MDCYEFTGLTFFSTVLARHLLAILGPPLASPVPNLLFLCGLSSAGVAQLVEHLICNQRVGGSIPSASSSSFEQGVKRSESRHGNMKGLVSLDTSPFCVFACSAPEDNTGTIETARCWCLTVFRGRVGEWLKPADCKSAAPCGLRRFESFPVHQHPFSAIHVPENSRAGD